MGVEAIMTKVIDLEKDEDGVYKPVRVRKTKYKEPKDEVDISPEAQTQRDKIRKTFPQTQADEILDGFDIGMALFNRIAKTIRGVEK